jgi:phage gp45-like
LIRRTFKRTDGLTAGETYEYDNSGKLIKAVWDKFDTWLTGTINFDYDKSGYLSRGHFKGNGEKKFDAEISFTFDKNKNLTKIHWDFSFKGTQTYTFGYEKLAF